jgi:hypothetical protein
MHSCTENLLFAMLPQLPWGFSGRLTHAMKTIFGQMLLRTVFWSLSYAARALCCILFLCSASGALAQSTDVLTYHNDNARSGHFNETVLRPDNINPGNFGLLRILPTDGEILAEPLYAGGVTIPGLGTCNVLFIESENDTVYAFAADSSNILWQASVAGTNDNETAYAIDTCTIVPKLGVTATPVIDRQFGPNGTIFIQAMSQDKYGNAHQTLHALDLATGQERITPVEITATYPGTGDDSSNGQLFFDPAAYYDRACLMLLNGVIYTFWSAHCNSLPATSWIIAYNEYTFAPAGVLNLEPNSFWGSIWNSSGGPAADTNGNIYVATGNGGPLTGSPGHVNFTNGLNAGGFPVDADYGCSLVKLSTANNSLTVTDYFAMSNVVEENFNDWDLGAGGPVVLPDMIDSESNTRQLVVIAGKDENVYLADCANMGKYNPANNNALYEELANVFTGTNDTPPDAHGMSGGNWSTPAYFNGTLYFGPVRGPITAFPFQNALLSASSSTSPTVFSYPGAIPCVSASGASNGIVWAVETVGKSGFYGLPNRTAVLHAYAATNLANEFYNSTQAANNRDEFGSVNDFATPTIANGRVYVPSSEGVGVFGLFKDLTLSGNFAFGGVAVNTSSNLTLTISNVTNSPLTITSISVPLGFSAVFSGQIAADASTNVTVTFSPTAVTNYGGTLTVNSDQTSGADALPISGYGASGNLTLVVLTNGDGVVSPNLNGRTFAAGSRHTLTATAKHGTVFTNWTGSITTNKNPLTFAMEESTLLQANFIPNPFAAVKGQYNGLFFNATNGVTEQTAGMLKGLLIGANGTYSGTILINGSSHSLTGTFNLSGQASNRISRPSAQGGALTVAMTLNWNNSPPQVTGTVSGITNGVSWADANLIADLATNTFGRAEYTLLLLPDANGLPPANSPGGDGYGLITNKAATATITGALADGTPFSQSTPISQAGDIPFYANLYGGKGLILGWVSLNPADNAGAGLTWIHPGRATGLYQNGFTNILLTNQIRLSPWTNSAANFGELTNLSLLENTTDTNTLITNIAVSVTAEGKMTETETGKVIGAVNLKTGLLTVTVGSGASKMIGRGVILLNATNGGGYYLTKTNAEAILLQP